MCIYIFSSTWFLIFHRDTALCSIKHSHPIFWFINFGIVHTIIFFITYTVTISSQRDWQTFWRILLFPHVIQKVKKKNLKSLYTKQKIHIYPLDNIRLSVFIYSWRRRQLKLKLFIFPLRILFISLFFHTLQKTFYPGWFSSVNILYSAIIYDSTKL